MDGIINSIINADVNEGLKMIDEKSVNCVVTSPPYFGLRDYNVDGQLGLEDTPEEYVANMVDVFRGIKRVLRDDGTVWLNLGDSYYNYRPGGTSQVKQSLAKNDGAVVEQSSKRNIKYDNLKEKDLVGIPWRVAFALQADGWYLRSDIIWHKPNPMPESVTDRPTKAHEYIFLLSKSQNYYYDYEAIKEKMLTHDLTSPRGSKGLSNANSGLRKQDGVGKRNYEGFNDRYNAPEKRNKRSVWTVSTKPFKEAHFAVFPEELIVPCVLAGCPRDGIVLDPFMGSGTTGIVARKLNRNFIGIELNEEYAEMARRRIKPYLDQVSIFDEGVMN